MLLTGGNEETEKGVWVIGATWEVRETSWDEGQGAYH